MGKSLAHMAGERGCVPGWGWIPTYLGRAGQGQVPKVGVKGLVPSLLNRISDTCENITFPRTRYVVGKTRRSCKAFIPTV